MQRLMPKIAVVSMAVILIVVVGVIIHLRNAPVEHVKVYEVQYEIEAPEPIVVRSASRVPASSADVSETAEAWSEPEEATHYDDTPVTSEFMEVRGAEEVAGAEEDVWDELPAAAMNPPTPPTRGLVTLIDSFPDDGTYEEFELRLTDYAFTYYPLTMLEPEEVRLLDPRAKAAYDRQKAAFHKEFVDMFKEDFASMSSDVLSMITPDMATLFEKEGILP